MKKEEKQNTEKAKYEKPILTKFRKLTDIAAGGNGSVPILGCTRF